MRFSLKSHCIVFLTLLLFLFVTTIFSYDRSTDSLALIALYDSTDGDNWTTKTNWKSDSTIDTWYGDKASAIPVKRNS